MSHCSDNSSPVAHLLRVGFLSPSSIGTGIVNVTDDLYVAKLEIFSWFTFSLTLKQRLTKSVTPFSLKHLLFFFQENVLTWFAPTLLVLPSQSLLAVPCLLYDL